MPSIAEIQYFGIYPICGIALIDKFVFKLLEHVTNKKEALLAMLIMKRRDNLYFQILRQGNMNRMDWFDNYDLYNYRKLQNGASL